MIELTPTHSLFPLWPPAGPSVWGWWSGVAVLLVAMLRYIWWKNYREVQTLAQVTSLDTEKQAFSREARLAELQDINTSVRTPEQKAEALLAHLFVYIDETITYDESRGVAYTLEQIKRKAGTEPLIPFFSELYRLIYSDSKITHSDLNILTKDIYTTCSGT